MDNTQKESPIDIKEEIKEEVMSDGQAKPATEHKPESETPPEEKKTEETLLAGKFKTAEELEKGYKESESKIGEMGQKVKEAEEKALKEINSLKSKLVAEGIELEEADEPEVSKDSNKVSELESKVNEMQFLKVNPEAESQIDLIKSVAESKYDGDLDEAIKDESIARILKLEKESKDKEAGTSVIETNKRITSGDGEYVDEFTKAVKNRGKSGAFIGVLRKKGIKSQEAK